MITNNDAIQTLFNVTAKVPSAIQQAVRRREQPMSTSSNPQRMQLLSEINAAAPPGRKKQRENASAAGQQLR
jgi:hypothetical protein